MCTILVLSCLLSGCTSPGEDIPAQTELKVEQNQNAATGSNLLPETTESGTEDMVSEPSDIPETTDIPEPTGIPESSIATEATDATEATEAAGAEESQEMVMCYTNNLELLQNPVPTDFVDVRKYIPDIYVDLKYAGNDNFTGEKIYCFEEAYLRYGTVLKLQKVCEELKEQGYYLKIWDAYRPSSAQFYLWTICPDARYVANPNRGFSNHTRGNALDVTLVDAWGRELPMPTEFDDFTDAANREYAQCSEEARQNALLLESVMEDNGFRGYWGEWWHYSDTAQYEAEKVFDPADMSIWYPKCNEFISLRERASGYSDVIDKIYLGSPFTVLGYTGQFALAQYNGQRGYVLTKYIRTYP